MGETAARPFLFGAPVDPITMKQTGVDTTAELLQVRLASGDPLIRESLDRRAARRVTYYQKHRLWADERHFVRWGDAHRALGCSSLALLRPGARDPLEAAAAGASEVSADAR